jgi:predicted NUDIX family phosphoesterase
MEKAEKVLVAPSEVVSELLKNGFTDGKGVAADLFIKVLESEQLSFLERKIAEINEDFKQLIPYCVLQNREGKIFSYQRTKFSGEQRLLGKKSIGIGGHINPIDGKAADKEAYLNGLDRELKEEVGFVPDYQYTFLVGFLYDDSDKVGRVHLGIVHQVLVDSPIEPKDLALSEGVWLSKEELAQDIDSYENWSKFLINFINSKEVNV